MSWQFSPFPSTQLHLQILQTGKNKAQFRFYLLKQRLDRQNLSLANRRLWLAPCFHFVALVFSLFCKRSYLLASWCQSKCLRHLFEISKFGDCSNKKKLPSAGDWQSRKIRQIRSRQNWWDTRRAWDSFGTFCTAKRYTVHTIQTVRTNYWGRVNGAPEIAPSGAKRVHKIIQLSE